MAGMASCPTAVGCALATSGLVLSTDQLNKILLDLDSSVLESNLNDFYSNPEVRHAFPFIQDPNNATQNTLFMMGAASGGAASFQSTIRGTGNTLDALSTVSTIKDLGSQ